jgi:N-dimethylarginine dimethylaminohydrolase
VERLGAQLEIIAPASTLPGMVFAANAGLIYEGRRLVLSRFRRPERRGESAQFQSWFEHQGYSIEQLPDEMFFEGEAEMRWWGDRFWAGSHLPDAIESHRWISRRVGAPVVSLRIVDCRFSHLDTCWCPLGQGLAAYYPEAFDEPSRRRLRDLIPRLLAIPRPEAFRFACNSIVVGDDVIVPSRCERTREMLEAEGFSVWPVDLRQFRLEAGGPKCLVLGLGAP